MSARRTDLYKVKGLRVASVTEMMKAVGLAEGFDMIDPEVLEHARLRGERIHAITDAIDNDMLWDDDPLDEELAPYIQAYMKFKEETGFVVERSEHVVVSASYYYAGTLDRTGYFTKLRVPEEQEFVGDLKAVAMVSPVTRIQTAAYGHAYSEQEGRGNLGRFSLQLKNDTTYRLEIYDRAQEDMAIWLSCVRLAHFKLANGLAAMREN